jgi:hypothetical protein
VEYALERPSFCASCGHRLPKSELSTGHDYDSEAPTVPPPENATIEIGAAPEVIGGYRLGRQLGAGAMGTVYEAQEIASGRRVALKLLASGIGATPQAIERFRREGRLAAAITHPRCVFVLAADSQAGEPYIVMELMPGSTLQDLVDKAGPLPPVEAVRKTLDVIEGLQEAHRLGVIHRDVKPSNCFLDADGRVKVGDFGLCKSLAGDANVTKTGTFMGTPAYSSPEQIRSLPLDGQTDVYSVAATLYFLLTGRPPFQTGDAAATLARIVADPVPSMLTLRPGIPPLLDKVVLRGLERERGHRWRDLDRFREALLRYLPVNLSRSGMGLRLAAWAIDFSAYFALSIVAFWLDFLPRILEGKYPPGEGDFLLTVVTISLNYWWVAYYIVAEGVWGWSLGKWFLRLRVCGVSSGEPPGIWRAAVRTLTFYAFTILPADLIWAAVPVVTPTWSYFIWASHIAGLLLLCSTMRWRSGYRGVHEWVSGTRVVRLPESRRAGRKIGSPGQLGSTHVLQPAGLPECIGQYRVLGAFRWSSAERVLLAEDLGLQRRVYVLMRPQGSPSLPAARRDLNRPCRSRWLSSGAHEDWEWDAFVYPTGCSIVDLLGDGKPFRWAEARPLLEELIAELTASLAEKSLPFQLEESQMWIGPTGQLQLLETSLADTKKETPLVSATDEERTMEFLGHVAILALEGRGRTADQQRLPIRAPLPGYATQFFNRLLGKDQAFRTLAEVDVAFRAFSDRPVAVSRGTRFSQLVVLALCACCALSLEYFFFSHLMLQLAYCTILVMFPFVWPSGPSLRLTKLMLVRTDGRPASGLQSAGRALLTWAPVAGLFLLELTDVLWSTTQSLQPSWREWLPFSIRLAALSLLPIYAILALINPTRGLHDRLVGTYLVPK